MKPGEATRTDAWLDEFERGMRAPAKRRRELRDEMETHVEDRVRDLLVAGQTEETAHERALDELGPPRALAESLDRVHRAHKRSMMMHAGVFVMAGAALLTGVVSLNQTPGTPKAIAPAMTIDAPLDDDLEALLATTVYLDTDSTWENLFEQILDAAGGSIIDWDDFDRIGASAEEALFVSADDAPIGVVLAMLNRRFDNDAVVLAPVSGGVEITSQSAIDARTVRLTAYDLSGIVDDDRVTSDDVIELITSFVAPGTWVDCGGEMARLSIVGDRMFVEAPARYDDRIAWIISQLEEGRTTAAGGAGRAVPGQGGGAVGEIPLVEAFLNGRNSEPTGGGRPVPGAGGWQSNASDPRGASSLGGGGGGAGRPSSTNRRPGAGDF